MTSPDLNLLIYLNVLLEEGSVAAASRKLRLSSSAMSRALTRLREATGDPLLVRAGRGLVPTPRALELRDQVSRLVQDVEAVLRPGTTLDLGRLSRTFTIRASDGFVENFGPKLLGLVGRDAPGVRLRFVTKLNRESAPLREGSVDLETGVVGESTGPEIRMRLLFRDRLVGVVRAKHTLSRSKVSLETYAASDHVFVSRRGTDKGAVDQALKDAGLSRRIAASVSGFSAALALARGTDLVATVPERHTEVLRQGMHTFPLPLKVAELSISMLWHPRMDADPAHRWLRESVYAACHA